MDGALRKPMSREAFLGWEATIFTRQRDDWVGHIVSGDATLAVPEGGIHLPLGELYDRVVLADAGSPSQPGTPEAL
jgi:hypothetical protein